MARGHHYLTLVYQIDAGCKRLLWIGQERTEQASARVLHALRQPNPADAAVRVQRLVAALLEVIAEQAERRRCMCWIGFTS